MLFWDCLTRLTSNEPPGNSFNTTRVSLTSVCNSPVPRHRASNSKRRITGYLLQRLGTSGSGDILSLGWLSRSGPICATYDLGPDKLISIN